MLSVLICRNFSQSKFNGPHIQMCKAKAGPWPHQMTQYFANDSVFYKQMNELDTVKIAECTQYGFAKHVDIFVGPTKNGTYHCPCVWVYFGCTLDVPWAGFKFTLGVLWMCLLWVALGMPWVCFRYIFGMRWVLIGYALGILCVCFGYILEKPVWWPAIA